MALPSRVLGAGTSSLATVSICGDAATVVGAGASTGNATQIASVITNVSTAAASTGVKLPKCEAGAECFIYNAGANTLAVYPATGDTINGTTSVTIATTKSRKFFGISATAWVSMLGA